MNKKRIERAYLEWARIWYSAFPPGDLVESESPDFIVFTLAGLFGFEVTQLFQPSSASRFSPKQIESFQEDVIRRAEDIYFSSDSPPVEVHAYFSVHPTEKQNKEQLAQAFSDFIRANYPRDEKVLIFHESDPMSTLPPSFGAVSIAPSLPNCRPPWFASRVGETKLLTYDFLAEVISAKNPLVAKYRARVSKIWLLVVADLFPSSANFSVPVEIDTWHFDYEFDQVLLLSRWESKVWALSPCKNGL